MIEIVVARYRESVAWLAPLAQHCRIYTKSDDPVDLSGARIERLPNVGRESHTYLSYIVANYDCLPPIVAFTQGAIDEELQEQHTLDYSTGRLKPARYILALVESAAKHGQSQNFFLNERIVPSCRATPELRMLSYKGAALSPAGKTLGEWYRDHFGVDYPASPPWYIHALFAVRRERIRQHPKELYEHLLRDLETENPEAGHFFEKTWLLLFADWKEGVPVYKTV